MNKKYVNTIEIHNYCKYDAKIIMSYQPIPHIKYLKNDNYKNKILKDNKPILFYDFFNNPDFVLVNIKDGIEGKYKGKNKKLVTVYNDFIFYSVWLKKNGEWVNVIYNQSHHYRNDIKLISRLESTSNFNIFKLKNNF